MGPRKNLLSTKIEVKKLVTLSLYSKSWVYCTVLFSLICSAFHGLSTHSEHIYECVCGDYGYRDSVLSSFIGRKYWEREAERDREMGGGQPVADNDPPGGQQNLSPLSCAAKTASTHFTLCFNYWCFILKTAVIRLQNGCRQCSKTASYTVRKLYWCRVMLSSV